MTFLKGDRIMNDLITIEGTQLTVKEWNNQRVVTFKDIDEVHQRPEGTAKRNFFNNKERFKINEDYFIIPYSEFSTNFVPNLSKGGNPDLEVYLLTEFGYMMLVKSFNDDLAWDVQRQLVNTYFQVKQMADSGELMLRKDFESAIEKIKQDMKNQYQQLTARVDLLDEGKVLMDTKKAKFIYEATEDLKEMMSDFGYSGEKYGQMLTDVLNKMEEMTHVPFSFYRDSYMQQKGLTKIENRLEVIAEYEELQYEFYSAIKQLYNKHDNLFEFGNVISEEELMDGVF